MLLSRLRRISTVSQQGCLLLRVVNLDSKTYTYMILHASDSQRRCLAARQPCEIVGEAILSRCSMRFKMFQAFSTGCENAPSFNRPALARAKGIPLRLQARLAHHLSLFLHRPHLALSA